MTKFPQYKRFLFFLVFCLIGNMAYSINAPFSYGSIIAKQITEPIKLTYVKDRMSFGTIVLYSQKYYYIVFPDLSVSFYNEQSQKIMNSNFNYEVVEVTLDEKSKSLYHDEYVIRYANAKADETPVRYVPAEPVGGIEKFQKDFMQKLVGTSFDSSININLLIKFNVAETGKLSDFKIINYYDLKDTAFKEEALRILRTMPKFEPATENGKKVASEYLFPLVIKVRVRY